MSSITSSKKKVPLPKDVGPIEKIFLKENQEPHTERLEEILSEQYCAFDMSSLGSGKTYTTSELSLRLEFSHVIVICPASLEAKWKDMAKYGVKLAKVISYQGLRSRVNAIPRHGLLRRHDSINEGTFFTPTEEYERLIDEGTLVVFDEVQHIKNKNDQFLACQALTSSILRSGGVSRFIFLSGTPIDKEEQAIHMMQIMGMIRSQKLSIFNKEENRLKLIGAQELVDFCKAIDPVNTLDFLRLHPFNRDNIHHNCYLIFQKIVKKNIAVAMPSPSLEIDVKNGYYRIENEDDKRKLVKGIIQLQTSVMFNEKEGTVNVAAGTFANIAPSLAMIESAKINTMARLAMERLDSNPDCKVGLFVNYNDSIARLTELLKDYKPLVLNGQVDKRHRLPILNKFQADSDAHRLIIGNIHVCSTGIDLDDKFGNRPRFAFAIPNYKILDLHQLTRRFIRLDSQSVPIFRFVYGNVGRKESSILNSLSRKSTVLAQTLESQVESDPDLKFPGELPTVEEDEE